MPTREYLTQEGLNKLKKELDFLRIAKRQEIVERIESATALGDISENSEYQEAKEAQAANEARVAELEEVLRRAVIIIHTNSGIVEVGSTVTVESSSSQERYIIVGSEEANPRQGRISLESPLGRAFLKKKAGDKIEAVTPSGVRQFRILKVE